MVGDAGGGLKAVTLARQLTAQLVIANVNLTSLNGIELTLQILADNPATKVIAFSMRSKIAKETGNGERLKQAREAKKAAP